MLPFYVSTLLQFYAPVVTTSQCASEQLRHLWSFTEEVLRSCESRCNVQWSDLAGAYRGAFLLAYQGKARVVGYKDWDIPQALLRITSSATVFAPFVERSSTRIKVAFVSTFFFRHSVGRLLGDVMLHLDRSIFDIHLIIPLTSVTEQVRTDDLHFELTSAFPVHYVTPSNFSTLPTLDIVVFGDLYMHQFTTFLSYHRFAPVQIVFWGHPYPSGSDHFYGHIDYFVSSNQFLPSLAADCSPPHAYEFGEQVLLFDSLSAHFLPSSAFTPLYFESRISLLVWLNNNAYDIHDRLLSTVISIDEQVCE